MQTEVMPPGELPPPENCDDETEAAVISYNIAVVLAQRHQYRRALAVLERSTRFLEAIGKILRNERE